MDQPPMAVKSDIPIQTLEANRSTDSKNAEVAQEDKLIMEASDAKADEKTPSSAPTPVEPIEPDYPHGLTFSIIFIALLLAMFLVALDTSIIATAIPRITSQFHSLDQVGWYGSAFFLTLAAFVSFWGKAYKYLPLKSAFLTSIFVFELGSLICAISPNSSTFIVGRAIQGAGGAGVTGGVYTIIALVLPLSKVPAYLGFFGAIFGLASVAGPLLGGVFTQRVTWRWCFYINLPVGGASALVLLIYFRTPDYVKPVSVPLRELLLLSDFPGIAILIASLVCFFLALKWGGTTKPWNSADVIGAIVGWGLLTFLWVVVEWKQGERALLVPRVLKRRTIAICSASIFCGNLASLARVYNLPIYFQAIDGVSPAESGIRILPTVLSISLFTFIGGGAVGKIGWFQPFLIIGSMVATIGNGLIYTFDIGTPPSKFIGYQVVAGVGVGLAIQVPVIVAQATSSRADTPIAISTVLSNVTAIFQFVGGAFGTSVAQSIFNNRLLANLPLYAPDVSPQKVIDVGASGLRAAFATEELMGVLRSYMVGLKNAWALSIAFSGLMFLISFCAEWKSLKTLSPAPAAGAANPAA